VSHAVAKAVGRARKCREAALARLRSVVLVVVARSPARAEADGVERNRHHLGEEQVSWTAAQELVARRRMLGSTIARPALRSSRHRYRNLVGEKQLRRRKKDREWKKR
jgi:hypothetical protein